MPQPVRFVRSFFPFVLALSAVLASALPGSAAAERIGDIATIQGVRDNAIIGYGLVVGLDNTGDQTTQTPFTAQTLNNMMSELGITIPSGVNMQLRNVAAAMVTAQLPAFASPGQQIDVTVSSVGTARSLRGGTLLMTPLKGADGQVYALAQGNLVIGGAGAQAAGSSITVNQLSAGRIPNGATIERGVLLDLGSDGLVGLDLKRADFTTATTAMNAINGYFGRSVASAIDGRTLMLQAPTDPSARVAFISQVQNIRMESAAPSPKVTINARTGSVVMNSDVRLRRAAVAHGSLSIVIDAQPIVSQPNPFGGGQTAVVPNANITMQQQGGALQMLNASPDLLDVVNALNMLGATPGDLISILEALKASGSLQAELEVI
ncbi:flagellar basal body P-ring protein FlgI [Halotalea alkalilenta]|uniref:flagellar basal body P-ring protein FlgI n=1 Tax=Halotalea alkalilenta TaxID=376489 RepID=UPI00048283B2|nr:flagellar basal body P-ring protein FlgI [Halotalea alkalilenta]